MAAHSSSIAELIEKINKLDPQALGSFAKKHPEMVCPVSKQIMHDPVSDSEGQTYNRVYIAKENITLFPNGFARTAIHNALARLLDDLNKTHSPQQNTPKAAYSLDDIFAFLDKGLKHKKNDDYSNAMPYFHLLAENDHICSINARKGCYYLARMYEEDAELKKIPGNNTKEYRLAHMQYWYTHAIKPIPHCNNEVLSEVRDALYRLGNLYEKNLVSFGAVSINAGQGLTPHDLTQPQQYRSEYGSSFEDKNKAVALALYAKAAQLGHIEAMYSLGMMWQREKSDNIAYDCYKNAANKGHMGALYALLEHPLTLYINQAEEKNAKSIWATWFRMSPDTTDIDAAKTLRDKLKAGSDGTENNKRFSSTEINALLSEELGEIVAEYPWVVNKLKRDWKALEPQAQKATARIGMNNGK